MTTLTCLLCNSHNYEVLKKYQHIGILKYGCSLVVCQDCGHFFTRTSKIEDPRNLYENEQYELIDTRRTLFGQLISFDVSSALRQLSQIKPFTKHASLLDFGCGKGVFLSLAAEHGWRVLGIETAQKRATFARKNYGLNVIIDDYSGGKIPSGPFDVITLFHILEHLPNPKELLKALLENNLKADGVLVVEVPRFESFQWTVAGSAWIHLDPPRHLSHFSTGALLQLLRDLGFSVLASRQSSIHNGLLGMVQAILSRLGYKKMLIEELKLRRTSNLILMVLTVLPFALCLELVAILFKRGGIIRLYCSRVIDPAIEKARS